MRPHRPPLDIPWYDAGTLCVTPLAGAAMPPCELYALLYRFRRADWGDVPAAWRERNAAAAEGGGDVVSCFALESGERAWVATDGGRRFTCVFLASEQC